MIARALSVGPFPLEGLMNTTELRHRALTSHCSIVDKVITQRVDFCHRVANKLFNFGIPVKLPDNTGANRRILELVQKNRYDLVWIDKGITIFADTLRETKRLQPHCKIIGYSPDLMTVRHNQSQQFLESLPEYDGYVTTKSYAVEEMSRMGAQRVLYQGNAYQEDFHYPRAVTPDDFERLGGDVGFIGVWEEERAKFILHLAKHGVNVRVWGDGKWLQYKGLFPNLRIEGRGLFTDEYCLALSAFKISLCFLRKMNFDQQTTRSVEIPACGGFMLAERTNEHLSLFEENVEAAYFETMDELLNKTIEYLGNDDRRRMVAKAGLERCQNSGYSYGERIRQALVWSSCLS